MTHLQLVMLIFAEHLEKAQFVFAKHSLRNAAIHNFLVSVTNRVFYKNKQGNSLLL